MALVRNRSTRRDSTNLELLAAGPQPRCPPDMLSEDQILQWHTDGRIELADLLPAELLATAAKQAAVRFLLRHSLTAHPAAASPEPGPPSSPRAACRQEHYEAGDRQNTRFPFQENRLGAVNDLTLHPSCLNIAAQVLFHKAFLSFLSHFLSRFSHTPSRCSQLLRQTDEFSIRLVQSTIVSYDDGFVPASSDSHHLCVSSPTAPESVVITLQYSTGSACLRRYLFSTFFSSTYVLTFLF